MNGDECIFERCKEYSYMYIVIHTWYMYIHTWYTYMYIIDQILNDMISIQCIPCNCNAVFWFQAFWWWICSYVLKIILRCFTQARSQGGQSPPKKKNGKKKGRGWEREGERGGGGERESAPPPIKKKKKKKSWLRAWLHSKPESNGVHTE